MISRVFWNPKLPPPPNRLTPLSKKLSKFKQYLRLISSLFVDFIVKATLLLSITIGNTSKNIAKAKTFLACCSLPIIVGTSNLEAS